MKKRIALLLSFVLVLSLALCACGGKGGEEATTIVGTWRADIELADLFNQEMEAAGVGDIINLDSFNLPLIMEFKADGTGSMSVDADAMNDTMDKLAEDLTAGLEAYFTEYFASMGVEIDLDEALDAYGISMDDLVEEMKAEFGAEDAFADFSNDFNYKAEDGKLYMSEDLDSEIDTSYYNTYELKGKTLILDAGTEEFDADMAEMAEYMFPMTLKRVK